MKKLFSRKSFLLVIVAAVCILFASCTGCNETVNYTRYQEETITAQSCGSSYSKEESEWLVSVINKDTENLIDAQDIKDQKIANFKALLDETNTSKYYLLTANMAKYEFLKLRTNKITLEYVTLVNTITDANLNTDYVADGDNATLNDIYIVLNGQAGCMDTTSKKDTLALKNDFKADGDTNIYRIAALYMIEISDSLGSGNYQYTEPIVFKGGDFGTVMANFWNNFFVFPVAWLFNAVSNLVGGYYWLGLLLVTLLIRTAGWPIYSKSNDMSLKMGLMQPELTKIQEKYAMRQDPESQRQMQMEQAQLYKKYGVGLSGCIAPLIQFPIFMAVYQAVSRLPYTVKYDNSIYTLDWANELNHTILGVDLFQDKYGEASGQLIGTIVLVLLVVGTQFASQWLSKALQKKQSDKKQENIPAYRRQAYTQTQNEQQQQMQLMMYMMMGMMGLFVWTSKLGLGMYWLIGNLFSMGQQIINSKTSLKKMEKLQAKHGIYTVKADNSKRK